MALEMFRTLKAPNFQAVLIERAEDVWPNFKALLSHEGHRPHARSSAW